jgi:hypothetical protein
VHSSAVDAGMLFAEVVMPLEWVLDREIQSVSQAISSGVELAIP